MRVGGEIHRYGLDEWWTTTFTEAERECIADTFRPLGSAGQPLIDGNTPRQAELHPGPFLANLASWINKPTLGDLALRIADEAASFEALPNDPSQAHFMFANLCKVYYRLREKQAGLLEKAVWACEQDIALSHKLRPDHLGGGVAVSHHCFKQLAIIEEKRGNYRRALELCRRAASEGWHGDWEKRIARIQARKAKAQE